jgi:hypothetical protein
LFKTHPDTTIRPELDGLGAPRSAGSTLADKRGLSTSIPESLGALGLGVLVLSALGVGIGAAYNYGQDGSAQNTLDAVKSAEILNQARTGTFGDLPTLTTGTDPALTQTAPSLVITSAARDYCAAIQSHSMFGPSYWITARSGKVLNAKPDATTAGVTCPDPTVVP